MTTTVSFLSRFRPPRFLAYIAVSAATVIAVGATFGGVVLPVAPPSAADKERVIETATPLIDAIRAYEKVDGKPPVSLEALVPRYLKELPTPPPDLCADDYLYAAEGKQWRIAASLRGKANRALTYSSQGDYPPGKPAAPVERIGAWAFFDSDPY